MVRNTDIINFLNGQVEMPRFDDFFAKKAKEHQDSLTKPQGSLGKLEDFIIWMAGWQKKIKPSMNNPHCLVFAGNHGVAKYGVSAYPQIVTHQMVENFKKGGAAINQLCKLAKIKLTVKPIELEKPTRDFTCNFAMDIDETISIMQLGYESVLENCDLLILGEMGISNTTSATAISCALFNQPVESWTGFGTGLDKSGVKKKISVIKSALKFHKKEFLNPESILSTFGGKEIAAIAGSIIAARVHNIPVLLDGFICTSAAATLTLFNKKILDHCLVSHISTEPAHLGILSYLKKEPILNLNMRLGEGSGAAVAAMILKSAIEIHNGMATFSEAGVHKKN